jgi:hypothetical protein
VYALEIVFSFIFSLFKTKIMKKKISIGLAAFLLMVGVACRKVPDVSCNSPTNDATLSMELICGNWLWVKSRKLSTGKIITSSDVGYQFQLTFTKDGRVEKYIDGNLVDTTTFEIAIEKKYTTFYGDTLRNVLAIGRPLGFGNPPPLIQHIVPIRICTDSLYLFYESYRSPVGDFYFARK